MEDPKLIKLILRVIGLFGSLLGGQEGLTQEGYLHFSYLDLSD